MPNEPETFLWLSDLSWSAISSISTAIAVVVALFLPFHDEKKKKKNLSKLIENEIKSNNDLLLRADKSMDINKDGINISRLSIMGAVLVNIDNSVWQDNKQTIAEISSDKYLQYAEITQSLERIKMYAIDINEKKLGTPAHQIIEDAVKKCIELITKNKIK